MDICKFGHKTGISSGTSALQVQTCLKTPNINWDSFVSVTDSGTKTKRGSFDYVLFI